MKDRSVLLDRRQFIKSTTAVVFGILSSIIAGIPGRAGGQSEKDASNIPKYICEICGYIYDPEKGDSSQEIRAGVPFETLPDTWKCPVCGVDKTMFKKM
ncbi:MAG TPA: rubredoxin [Syntrophales bacterium]|nr:rubredoxin [Syntrophales bacterium]